MQSWALSFWKYDWDIRDNSSLKPGHISFELFAHLAHGLWISVLPYRVLVRTGEGLVQASYEKVGEATEMAFAGVKGQILMSH